jgi:putative IMPACT (imprinted ancient) family translation regulator
MYLYISFIINIVGIAVIVSRWFGGTKLGPDRFKLILNSARQLLEEHNVPMKKK